MRLFSSQPWTLFAQEWEWQVSMSIQQLSNGEVLSQNQQTSIDSLISSHVVEPLELFYEQRHLVNAGDTNLGTAALRHPASWVLPVAAPGSNGIIVYMEIPFRGPEELFYVIPTQWTAQRPDGNIRDSKVSFQFLAPAHAQEQIIEMQSQSTLMVLQSYVSYINNDVAALNKRVRGMVTEGVQARYHRFSQSQEMLNRLNNDSE